MIRVGAPSSNFESPLVVLRENRASMSELSHNAYHTLLTKGVTSMRVFISHASADKSLARKLRDALSTNGINVWIDEAEIRVGQSIPAEIQRALHASDVLCLLISAASTHSRWVTRELNSFLPLFIDGSRVLVPCRVDSSPVPSLIQDIKYADFRGQFAVGFNALLNAVKIREAVSKKRRLESLRDLAIAELSAKEMAFFLSWVEGDTIDCFEDDYDEARISASRPQLKTLTRLGLVNEYPSCRGKWYDLSPDGVIVQRLINAD